MLEIGLSCHISKVVAFGTEMMHRQIKLTSEETTSFPRFGFFSLGLRFFLQVWAFLFRKERQHLEIQSYRSLLRKMLFGKLYISSGKISIRH